MARVKQRRKGHGRRSASRGGGSFVSSVIGIEDFLPPSVAQGSGTVSPLQVLGFGFTLTTEVHFNGALVPSTYSSSTVMAITVQASTVLVPGFYPVYVTDVFYPATSTTKVWSVNFPVPTLGSLSPTFAYLGAPSAAVTTTGSGFFTAGTNALVDGVNRAWSYATATTGTLTIPTVDLLAAGTLSVVMVNPEPGGGTSVARTFSVRYRTPAITAVSTGVIPINSGDYALTLTDAAGGYYNPPAWPDGGTVGTVDNVPVPTAWLSPTQVTLTIPASVTSVPGVKAIRVVNPTVGGGGGTSAPTNISVSAPTTTGLGFATRVRGFDPYLLRVTGTNLTASDAVHYRGAPLATTYVSGTALDGLIPASVLAVAGAGDVTVVTATGYETNAQTFTVLGWEYMEIGTTLRGYYPASTLVDDGTGRASQWTESVTGVRNPVQPDPAIRPNIIASVPTLNGKPAAFFDGTRGDFLEMEQWIVSTTTGLITKTELNLWIVGSALYGAQVASNPAMLGDPGGFLAYGRITTPGVEALDSTGGSVTVNAPFNWLAGQAMNVRVRKTGGSLFVRVNKGAEVSAPHGANPVLFTPTNVLVGKGTATANFYTGFIGGFLACDSNVNPTHRAQIDNLLAAEFGTSFGTTGAVLAPTAVAPNTGTQFDTPFDITVTVPGGAVTGDVVNVDNHVLATVVSTPTTLTATLTAAALFTPGIKGVTVANANGIGPPVALTIAPFVPGTGPNLTSISPVSCVRCDDAFPLPCTGLNFTPTSVVYADAIPLPTSYSSPTLITATVTDAVLFTAGVKAITVHDTGGNSGAQTLTVSPWTFNSVPEVTGWWEGDDVNAAGGFVSQMNDKTGLLHHAIQATGTKQPALIAADPNFNGQPSVDFDGTNDDLVVAGFGGFVLLPNTQNASIVVYRADAITTSSGTAAPHANSTIVGLTGSGYYGIVVRTGPLMYGFSNDGAPKVTQNAALLALTTQCAIFRRQAGTLYLSINGGVEATIASGNANTSGAQNVSIGSGLGTYFFNGQVACYGTFAATPSAANLARIKNYTRIKFGWTP